MSTTVFLDTVGLLALWDKADQWHQAADSAFSSLAQERAPIMTSTYVLLECGNAASRRPYRAAVMRLRNSLQAASQLVAPTSEDLDGAWEAYARGEAGQAGIVDLVSFRMMHRLNISRAFTNDSHFRAAGFQVLF